MLSQEQNYSVVQMCKSLEVSKSAYYSYRSGIKNGQDLSELDHSVISIFWRHKRRYGSRRIVADLRDDGIMVGRRRISSIMQRHSLKAIQPKSYVPKTTQSPPGMLRSPNLLLDHAGPTDINQVWIGDITYLPIRDNKWGYLSVWQDLFSRYIVGWQVLEHMRKSLVTESFEKALYIRQPTKGLIVHSDGGGQYGSKVFRRLLSNTESRQSMTRRDNHYDNATAESWFSRLKAELLEDSCFDNLEHARSACFEYIDAYYNTIRRHSSLDYKTPLQFERELVQRN